MKRVMTISTAGIVMLVVLRLAVGWHLFCEGMAKHVKHQSSEPYLRQAKGPLKEFYLSLLPDFHGFEVTILADDPPDPVTYSQWYRRNEQSWQRDRERFVMFYELDDENAAGVDKIYKEHREKIEQHLKAHNDEIIAYLEQREKLQKELAAARDENKPGEIRQIDAKLAELEESAGAAWKNKVPDYQRNFRRALPGELSKEQKAGRDTFPDAALYDPWVKNIIEAWDQYAKRAADHYDFNEDQQQQARQILSGHKQHLWRYLSDELSRPNADADQDDVGFVEYRKHVRRLAEEKRRAGSGDVPTQRDRAAAEQTKLAAAAGKWKAWVRGQEQDLQNALYVLHTRAAADKDDAPVKDQLSFGGTRLATLDTVIKWGLMAVGACLFLGLFTRTAALGGAVFMLGVVLAQPAYPGVFPPPPPTAGNPIFVTKELLEMLVLCLLAVTTAGRWAGLDFFIHACLTGQCCSRSKPKGTEHAS